MALNDILKKLTLSGLDCKGLYIKDTSNIFTCKQIDKNNLKKLDYNNINIVLKFYFKNKQIKKTLHFYNITALQAVKNSIAKRTELKNELETKGVLTKKDFRSLDELWNDYMKFKSESLSKNNIYSSKKSYNKWIKPAIGSMKINNITTSDIQDIVNKILRQGLKPRTAQTIKQLLRPLWKYSIDIGISEKNPALKVEIPSFDNTVNFELTDDERKKLFNEIKIYEPFKYRGIMLFLYTGRRLNEVLTLRWESISIELQEYTIQAKYSKIKRAQTYKIPELIRTFLKNYGFKKTGSVFPGDNTIQVPSSTFRRHWKKVLKNAGIEYMRIHDTRHLLGNTLVNHGESLENIGKALGHSSVAVTKRYAKTSKETAGKLVDSYLGEV